MAEDQDKLALTDRQAAFASVRRAQEKGSWPKREPAPEEEKVRQELTEQATKLTETAKPTLTPENIKPEQVGRIAGKLYNEGIQAKGGAERFKRLVASAEETEIASQERSQKLAENIAARYKQKQLEKEAESYVLPSQKPPPPRPFTPAPVSRPTAEENLRQQVSQTPSATETKKGGIAGFFSRLFRR